MTVREQLHAAYVVSGMTMPQIAILAGCHENTVARAISTGGNVTSENLFAIAAVLNIEAIRIPRR